MRHDERDLDAAVIPEKGFAGSFRRLWPAVNDEPQGIDAICLGESIARYFGAKYLDSILPPSTDDGVANDVRARQGALRLAGNLNLIDDVLSAIGAEEVDERTVWFRFRVQ